MNNKRNYKRDSNIFNLRLKGLTFREIGEKYKICAGRARELYFREEDRLMHLKLIYKRRKSIN